MISFLRNLFANNRNKREKQSELSITVDITGSTFTVNSADISMSKIELAEAKIRKARLYKRHERLMRHKRIWAVLNYAKCLEAINNAANFYDLDKALLDHQRAVERFNDLEFHPSIENIYCAIRFCDIKYCQGECEHYLTSEDKNIVFNLRANTLDYDTILKNVSNRFISCWDVTLDRYKQNNARKRRIEYLINHLDEVKNRKGLSTIPHITDYLNNLKAHYRDRDI